jgi:hypothetical protein
MHTGVQTASIRVVGGCEQRDHVDGIPAGDRRVRANESCVIAKRARDQPVLLW